MMLPNTSNTPVPEYQTQRRGAALKIDLVPQRTPAPPLAVNDDIIRDVLTPKEAAV